MSGEILRHIIGLPTTSRLDRSRITCIIIGVKTEIMKIFHLSFKKDKIQIIC